MHINAHIKMAIAPYISHFTQREIRIIFNKARRVYSDSGLVLLMHPSTKDFGRILVITSRKVGNAPERNKIRRRLKAIFYKEKLYTAKQDCFVIIKKPGIDYSTAKLTDILQHSFTPFAQQS